MCKNVNQMTAYLVSMQSRYEILSDDMRHRSGTDSSVDSSCGFDSQAIGLALCGAVAWAGLTRLAHLVKLARSSICTRLWKIISPHTKHQDKQGA